MTQLLTIRGAGGSWGVPSSAVASVEPLGPTPGGPLLDFLGLLGVATPDAVDPFTAGARVLVLEVQGQRLPLLVQGTLELSQAASTDLLELPAAVQAQAPLISHLAVVDGRPTLFVVSPYRLMEAARRATQASSAAFLPHDSARGSSC